MPTPTLFPFVHDWGEPFKITRQYSTDVQKSFDGTEVRVKRAADATIRCTMRVLFNTTMGAGRLLAQWRGATRPLLYYAPLWCDVTSLTSAVTAGDGSIALDATDRPFFEVPSTGTGYTMLWRSPENAEVVSFTASDASSLTLSGAVANSYAIAGTKIVPCRPMWLSMPVSVTWESAVIAHADLSFSEAKPQAGIGLAGTSTMAVVASIKVWRSVEVLLLPAGNYDTLQAMAFDANGLPIPDAQFTWEVSHPNSWIVPDGSTKRARHYVGSPDLGQTVTVTSGGVSLVSGNPLPIGFG